MKKFSKFLYVAFNGRLDLAGSAESVMMVTFACQLGCLWSLWLQVLSKREQYGKLDKAVMSIWECCELLNEFVDESDPDLDEPQIEHLLQTAEAIRKDYPNEDWLHLTGLIHGMSYPV